MVLFSALVTAFVISTAQAHSAVERLSRIAPNGTMVGPPGYIRGYFQRMGFKGNFDDYIIQKFLPPIEGSVDQPNDLVHPNQRTFNYSQAYPPLTAAPGDLIALQYQENGHTTKIQHPWIPPPDQLSGPSRPLNSGTVYIYGTYNLNTSAKLLDVHYQWNPQGTGGDGKGKLLATRNFDDGKCYQISEWPKAIARKAKFPKPDGDPGDADLWCQNDITLPNDLEIGKPYTLIWIWDWPQIKPEFENTTETSPKSPLGFNFSDTPIQTPELYSSVMDINIVDPCDTDKLGGMTGAACKTSTKVSFRMKEVDLNKAAIAEQCTDNNFAVDVSHLYQDAPPASPSGDGTASATAPASSSTQTRRIKTEVVTVPLTTLTVYASSTETVMTSVTVTDTVSSSAVASESTTTSTTTAMATTSVTLPSTQASGPPSVSPFLPSTTPRARKGRRNAGKWTFGQD